MGNKPLDSGAIDFIQTQARPAGCAEMHQRATSQCAQHFRFPPRPWTVMAHSIWLTWNPFFLCLCPARSRCIEDSAFIAGNGTVVLTFVTLQRHFPQKQRGKQTWSVWLTWWFSCAVHADRITLAPAIPLFLTVFMAAKGEEQRRICF